MDEVHQGYAWIVSRADGSGAAGFKAVWTEWSYEHDDDEVFDFKRPSDGTMVGYWVEGVFDPKAKNQRPGDISGYIVVTQRPAIQPANGWKAMPWPPPKPNEQRFTGKDITDGKEFIFNRVTGPSVIQADGHEVYPCEFTTKNFHGD